MKQNRSVLAAAFACICAAVNTSDALAAAPAESRFDVYFPPAVHRAPITGRIIVTIRRAGESDRVAGPIFGQDVSALQPGETATVGPLAEGFPLQSLADLAPGSYTAQALLNVYTRFVRSDGHVIWAHMDHWEGQQYKLSPGNLYSTMQTFHVDGSHHFEVSLALTHVIPPITVPPDTMWVKHVKIQSALLTKFWGRPMYLGAVILLPKGYASHPEMKYPVVYYQDHFSLDAPLGFSTGKTPLSAYDRWKRKHNGVESDYEFYQSWNSGHFPRVILVSFLHPTPYFDDSYAVNSANNGPYGDAIMTELIPYIETHFRIVRHPYARVLMGGSTGGWEALALQLFHPSFFGGAWVLYPDPIDFHHYDLIDIYRDRNAFFSRPAGGHPILDSFSDWNGWASPPQRIFMREANGQPLMSVKEWSAMEAAEGSHSRSANQFAIWNAVYGPVGADGYPKPLWDANGRIDHSVATYMRDHGYDLTYYTQTHWTQIGSQLVGKLHFMVGDMDNFYLNLAVYDMQAFLQKTSHPYYAGSFEFGRPEKGHGWESVTSAGLVKEMASYILRNSPKDENSSWYGD
jgi:hypothetical protein